MWPQHHWGTNGGKIRGRWIVEVVTVSYLDGILEILSAGNFIYNLRKSPVLSVQEILITSFLSYLPQPNLKIVSTLMGRDAYLSDILRWRKKLRTIHLGLLTNF